MFPDLIDLGFMHLRTYGACMAIGFLVCWHLIERLSGRKDLSNLLLSLIFSGIIGSRAAYVIEHWQAEFAVNPSAIIRVDQGGLMFYGGLILAIVVFFLWCAAKRENPLSLGDLLAAVIPLGHAFGRIGCFFYGCCYGRDSECWCAVVFPKGSPSWYEHSRQMVPVLPTQLFEAAALLVLFAALMWLWRRPWRKPGTIAGAYLIGYAVIRFGMEYLRGDPRAAVGPFSISQTISLGMIIIGLSLMLAHKFKRGAIAVVLLMAGGSAFAKGEPFHTEVYAPVSVTTNAAGNVLVDFGVTRFGWVELLDDNPGEYDLRVGEIVRDGAIWFPPAESNIRAIRVATHKYHGVNRVPLPTDPRNTHPRNNPVQLPSELGTVLPIRAVEFVSAPFVPSVSNVQLVGISCNLDVTETDFRCSDARLNRLWDFCKHTIRATSFLGMFVDGDRERLPYEGDSLGSQLALYATFTDTAIPVRTFERLMKFPTWPAEGAETMIIVAWNHWRRTGDLALARQWFDHLYKTKLRKYQSRADGLLICGTRWANVDWPRCERDGFVTCEVNASVNAYHVRALLCMAEMAAAIGRGEAATELRAEYEKTKAAYNRVFFNAATGHYRDGEGTDHESMHVNALALAFDICPDAHVRKVAAFVASRPRVCSPYFMLFQFEALMRGAQEAEIFANLLADDERSYLGMLKFGATIGLESWNDKIKPNLDANHSWAAVPAAVLAKYVAGVDWLNPDKLTPHLGPLDWVEGTFPVKDGLMKVRIEKDASGAAKIVRREFVSAN